jgi:hypothetical protein
MEIVQQGGGLARGWLRLNRAYNMRPITNAAIRETIRVAVLKSSMRENIAARVRSVNFPYGEGCPTFPTPAIPQLILSFTQYAITGGARRSSLDDLIGTGEESFC